MFAQYAFPTTAARAIELGDVEASSFTGSRRFRRTAVGTGGARQSVSPNLGKAYALFSSSRSFVTSRSFWKNRFDKGRKARRFCQGSAFVSSNHFCRRRGVPPLACHRGSIDHWVGFSCAELTRTTAGQSARTQSYTISYRRTSTKMLGYGFGGRKL